MVHREMFRKRPKIKIFSGDRIEGVESWVNEFIKNKDIEDIQYSSIVYEHLIITRIMVFYYE